MREAVIVAMSRTGIGRARKGTTRTTRPEELAKAVVQDVLRQVDGRLDPARIDDLIVGCAIPEGSQGLNVARAIGLQAGLPVEVPCPSRAASSSSALSRISRRV